MGIERIKKYGRLLSVAFSVLLACMLILSIGQYKTVKDSLLVDTAGKSWKGTAITEFSQYAVYFSSVNEIGQKDIQKFRKNANQTLNNVSQDEAVSSWVDCYMAETNVDASYAYREATLDAYGVGGEFFLFHPFPLLSGRYLSETDRSENGVILDNYASWELFGSVDVVGKHIKVGNAHFVVSGVVQGENVEVIPAEPNQRRGKIYFDYAALNRLSEIPITSYEMVFPEPIENFSYQCLQREFSISSPQIVENSNRFSATRLLKQSFSMEEQLIQDKEIAYPEFENTARVIEYRLIKILWRVIILAVAFLFNGIQFVKPIWTRIRKIERRKTDGKCNPKKY